MLKFIPPELRAPAQPWEVFLGSGSLETPPTISALIRDHGSAKTKEVNAASRHQRARLAPKGKGRAPSVGALGESRTWACLALAQALPPPPRLKDLA